MHTHRKKNPKGPSRGPSGGYYPIPNSPKRSPADLQKTSKKTLKKERLIVGSNHWPIGVCWFTSITAERAANCANQPLNWLEDSSHTMLFISNFSCPPTFNLATLRGPRKQPIHSQVRFPISSIHFSSPFDCPRGYQSKTPSLPSFSSQTRWWCTY